MSVEGYYYTIGKHDGNDLGECIGSDSPARTLKEVCANARAHLQQEQQPTDDQIVVVWRVERVAVYRSELERRIHLREAE